MNATYEVLADEAQTDDIQVLDAEAIDAVGGAIGPFALVLIAAAGGAAAGAAGAYAISKVGEWIVY